jgi:hypothetical protein
MKFKTILQLHGKTATGIEVPEKLVESLGSGKRPPVRVTLKGHTYRSTIAPMGGKFMIGVSAENREKAGVTAGDEVQVTIELDDQPREVELPADFKKALSQNAAAKKFFNDLSYSHKRRYVLLIEQAQTDETRRRRIDKSIKMFEEGKK